MPQLLYVLHNFPMVVLLKIFWIINSIFRSLIWHFKPARVRLEQLQHPQDARGLALPNPWLYYLASQLQHIVRVVHPPQELELNLFYSEEEGGGWSETLHFSKSNKLHPTYVLMQKVWNTVRMMQGVQGFTKYSPIWDNNYFPEIAKLQYGTKWKQFGISHLSYIFQDERLRSFSETFRLTSTMHFL